MNANQTTTKTTTPLTERSPTQKKSFISTTSASTNSSFKTDSTLTQADLNAIKRSNKQKKKFASIFFKINIHLRKRSLLKLLKRRSSKLTIMSDNNKKTDQARDKNNNNTRQNAHDETTSSNMTSPSDITLQVDLEVPIANEASVFSRSDDSLASSRSEDEELNKTIIENDRTLTNVKEALAQSGPSMSTLSVSPSPSEATILDRNESDLSLKNSSLPQLPCDDDVPTKLSHSESISTSSSCASIAEPNCEMNTDKQAEWSNFSFSDENMQKIAAPFVTNVHAWANIGGRQVLPQAANFLVDERDLIPEKDGDPSLNRSNDAKNKSTQITGETPPCQDLDPELDHNLDADLDDDEAFYDADNTPADAIYFENKRIFYPPKISNNLSDPNTDSIQNRTFMPVDQDHIQPPIPKTPVKLPQSAAFFPPLANDPPGAPVAILNSPPELPQAPKSASNLAQSEISMSVCSQTSITKVTSVSDNVSFEEPTPTVKSPKNSTPKNSHVHDEKRESSVKPAPVCPEINSSPEKNVELKNSSSTFDEDKKCTPPSAETGFKLVPVCPQKSSPVEANSPMKIELKNSSSQAWVIQNLNLIKR